jgi:hypothetical protein
MLPVLDSEGGLTDFITPGELLDAMGRGSAT